MARKTKQEMAEYLKGNGYFWKYKYVSDIVKTFSWDDLDTYYREAKANIGYPDIA